MAPAAPSEQTFPQLSTRRLLLRQAHRSDFANLLTILGDPQVMRYYDMEPLTTIEELAPMLQRWRERFQQGSGIRWAIALGDSDSVIGTCGLGFQPGHRKASLGYELARTHWRQGYMTEALQAILQYAFQQRHLHRIEALVMPENEASIALLQSLGFGQEGRLRDYYYFRGQHHDLLSFSRLATDSVDD